MPSPSYWPCAFGGSAAGGNYTSIRALGSGITTLAIVLLLAPYVDRFAARQVCHRLLDRVVKAAKKNKFYGIPTRYRFYDDKLDASDSAGSVETPYSQVTDLVETERYFLVFLKSGQCVLAAKRILPWERRRISRISSPARVDGICAFLKCPSAMGADFPFLLSIVHLEHPPSKQ